jgi:cell division inhibitor SepF
MPRDLRAVERDDDEDDEYETGGGGWFSRLKNRFNGVPMEDDEEYEDEAPARPAVARHGGGNAGQSGARAYSSAATASHVTGASPSAPGGAPSRQTFRIASARESSITVMPVMNFADIQRAADRLKTGEAQIINLEKTPAEVSERLIDFLNGVTYALDGYVEKISEGAYLFTPSHITIQAEGAQPPQPKPFFDR